MESMNGRPNFEITIQKKGVLQGFTNGGSNCFIGKLYIIYFRFTPFFQYLSFSIYKCH